MIPDAVNNLLIEMIPMILLFIILIIMLKIVIIIYGHKKGNIWYEFKIVLYVIYAFILFELVTSTDFESYSNNFIPFKEILRYKITSPLFYRNVLGNILLFIPFSYEITDIIKMLLNKYNLFITMIICIITSLCIEVIQMYIGRSFDVDDIILNTIGSIFGCIIFYLFHRRKHE